MRDAVAAPVFGVRLYCFMDKESIYRAIDANANRAVEGVRAVEDAARFVLNRGEVSARLRELRRQLRDTAAALPGGAVRLLFARDSAGDVGRNALAAPHENIDALIASNFKRAQEATRALEEFSRLLDPAAASAFGDIRFQLYDIEKELAAMHSNLMPPPPFLYFAADGETLASGGSFDFLKTVLDAGCAVVQLREKNRTDHELLHTAESVARAMEPWGALLFVNDRVDIALAAGAHGVHLGQDELPLEAARAVAGNRLLYGVSTNSIEEAERAALHNPDYISVGAVFASPTKPQRRVVGNTLVASVAHKFDIPVVGIGGININNAASVIAAGAAGVAVISDISSAADPAAQTSRIIEAINSVAEKHDDNGGTS